MTIRKLSTAIVIALLVLMYATLKSWPFFPFNIPILSAVIAILLFLLGGKYMNIRSTSVGSVVLCILAVLLCNLGGNLYAYFGGLLGISPFIVYLFFCDDVKIRFLQIFNYSFSLVIVISLFFWILFLIGIPLPHSSLTFGENYTYDNYYFFLRFNRIDLLSFFPRFYSIFIEPGELACYLVFLLFLDGFRMKWYNIVYIIALILTFSLAGLFLLIFTLIPSILKKTGGKDKRSIVLLLLLLVGGAYYAINSKEDSVAYQLLGSRMQIDDETGTIEGYDRSTADFNNYWKNHFLKSNGIWFGEGQNLPYQGVDLKIFIARFGIFPLLFYILFLLTCTFYRNSYKGYWCFVLLVLIVYRGYSMMFYPGVLVLFTSGLSLFYYSKNGEIRAWPERQ